jgi:glycolate oxidase iron-sulfur subunit
MRKPIHLEHSVDRCVQCGFCLPACPTYRLFEREDSSPRGRIALARALAGGEIEPVMTTLATYDECLGCRACEPACPSGVVYEEVLLYGRELLAQETGHAPLQVRALLYFIRWPLLLTLARWSWRYLGRVLPRAIRRIPRLPQTLSLLAALPDPAPTAAAPAHGPQDVLIHRGCLMDVLWEGTNNRAVLLLRRAGLASDLLSPGAGCCGALHGHQGQMETARSLARRVIETWELAGRPTLVSLAGGCGAFMRGYSELFPSEEDPWHERAREFSRSMRDLSSVLMGAGWHGSRRSERVTYQDSCHLRNGMGVWREPRTLLESVSDLIELPGADTCCGSAGVYNLLRPDVANRLLEQKVRTIEGLGVDTVITSNPGCELQLRLGILRSGSPANVRHIADHLFEHSSES